MTPIEEKRISLARRTLKGAGIIARGGANDTDFSEEYRTQCRKELEMQEMLLRCMDACIEAAKEERWGHSHVFSNADLFLLAYKTGDKNGFDFFQQAITGDT